MFCNFRINIVLLIILCVGIKTFSSDERLIYGGDGHDQFLGCLVCSEYSSESICNGNATYGNEFSSASMFNEYSSFGNEYSSSSPWNEYSTSKSVPIIVDRDGNFYGYFTINDARSDAVKYSSDLLKLFKYSKGDLEKLRMSICKALDYNGN
jgi:hypothetical protein